jgi:acetyltransferase-like isoleucine patch superfamily enzyme
VEQKKLSTTFKLLRALGFNYPVEDYGDISIWRVVKQFFMNWYHRLLINSMNWSIIEPFNPRKLRPATLRKLGAKVGRGVFVGDYVRVDLNHSDLLIIEDGVHIAGDVRLLCHKKDLSNYTKGDIYGMQPYKYGKIHLCKNCAIGTGSLVMSGVTVGEGAVVGAGSLVTKDIPAWTIATGRPAKVVKHIPQKQDNEHSDI